MKKFSMGMTLLTMALSLFFVSCEKDVWEPCPDDTTYPDDSNGKPPVEKQLQIALNNEYMPVSKIDSAIAIWEVNGTSKTVKLEAQDNQLSTRLSNFQQSGSGTLTVQIFSQIQVDGRDLQWETRLPYTMDRNINKVLEGPQNIKDPSWNPRVIFKYGNTSNERFSFIVAMRPNDPYFELKGVKPEYASRIDIMRNFYKKESGELVLYRGWVCSAACLDNKGNLLNREYFSTLPQLLNGKQWDNFRITAYFYVTNNPNKTYEYFDFRQDLQ